MKTASQVFRALGLMLVISGSIALTACQTAPVPWAVPDGVATISVNGYPMAYRSKGSGPTVVMVAGVMCDYRCLDGQLEGLSNSHRVITVSLRHFYPERWDGTGSDFSVVQHANDLIAFLERIGPPVYVVAQSYGAHVSYEAARRRPDLFRKLIMAEAPVDSLLAATGDQIRQQRASETEAIFKRDGTEAGLEFAVDAINGQGAWTKLPAAAKGVVRDNAWTVVGIGKDDAPRVRCEDFAALKMPVMLVMGENTTPRFRRLVQAQSACLKNAPVVTIPRAGHGTPYQNPADFNRAVRSFLE
ncbi:MAG TPA: alpha/beta hydrolase [Ramlibacter sp.]|nr:alpha/beta hydrolase [Ramlibacter sp.]